MASAPVFRLGCSLSNIWVQLSMGTASWRIAHMIRLQPSIIDSNDRENNDDKCADSTKQVISITVEE